MHTDTCTLTHPLTSTRARAHTLTHAHTHTHTQTHKHTRKPRTIKILIRKIICTNPLFSDRYKFTALYEKIEFETTH